MSVPYWIPPGMVRAYEDFQRRNNMSEVQYPTTFWNAIVGVCKGESWTMTHWAQGVFIRKNAGGTVRIHDSTGRSARDFIPTSGNFGSDWVRCSTALEDAGAKLEKLQHAFGISEQFVIEGRNQIAALKANANVQDKELADRAQSRDYWRGQSQQWETRALNAEQVPPVKAYNELAGLHANQKRVIARLQNELDTAKAINAGLGERIENQAQTIQTVQDVVRC